MGWRKGTTAEQGGSRTSRVKGAPDWTPVTAPPATEEAANEAINEFWRKTPNVADTARARAQVSFSIVSVASAALLSGAVFLGKKDVTWYTGLAAVVASLAWIAAFLLYLRAANVPVGDDPSADDQLRKMPVTTTPEIALYIANLFQRERHYVVRNTYLANRAAALAIALSALTAATVWLGPSPTEKTVSVVMQSAACQSLQLPCDGAGRLSSVKLDVDDFASKEFVEIELAAPGSPCVAAATRSVLVSRSSVRGVEVAQ